MAKFKVGDSIVPTNSATQYERIVIGTTSNDLVVYEYRDRSNNICIGDAPEDTFKLKPSKKEGWVNVYPGFGSNLNTLGKVYATEAEAKINVGQGCLDTIKIEWEE